ncbi:MAG: hydrolase 2, exosortase A system-associated [Pseudomonadales bacterium]|nr:hydrolase 2, exosortase A system-associated [Pseudomonadales bacterium]MCP5172662.1 hydrolase 2, exosortase A system-associated [Pseudomonadales bacterium]MCP5302136.1 hydrolase 2, exosortase A system-associated [Pseudomonadales bacterium]
MNQPFFLKPGFIEGEKGPLFAIHHEPVIKADRNECVVVLSAFAEEMNRCRYMQNMLAQALNKQGYGLICVDPYGTGDSAGEFADADWNGWVSDSITAIHYAAELGYNKISLLGIRLGALLALAAMPSVNNVSHLLLWQPVYNGKATLTQFLRLKIAAAMARGEDGITTAQLEDEINQGSSIQIAGYDVSPGLFKGIQQAHINHHFDAIPASVSWFTVLPSADKKAPRADLQTIEKWRSKGVQINHQNIVGPAFWQAHERTLAPDLVPATLAAVIGGEAP